MISGWAANACTIMAEQNTISQRARMRSNENKMSDGGRGRASLGVEVWKSSQKWSARAVRRSLHRLVRSSVAR